MAYSVLLLGATGYLGGDILTTLEHNDNYDITCVVRPGKEGSLKGRKADILVVRPIVSSKHSNCYGSMMRSFLLELTLRTLPTRLIIHC